MSRGYHSLVRITSYGPYVTKLILPVDAEVTEISTDSFEVYKERYAPNGKILRTPVNGGFAIAPTEFADSKGIIPVRASYPSDEKGNKLEKGTYITLETAYGPQYGLSSEINYSGNYNVYVKGLYVITQKKAITSADGELEGLVYSVPMNVYSPDTEGFLNRVSHDETYPLRYGYYVPEDLSVKRPLLIWLHGAGEGGEDPTVAYTGNKVTVLASPEVQDYFGGAYVYAPQTPTFWLDDGAGTMALSGKSRYTEALMSAIEEFVSKNPCVDRNRIYIGGDSNGGFMTMRMILSYPDYFAAAFPVCEAFPDAKLTDEDIEAIKNVPIWFTHAKNDPIVKPSEFVVPTYERLKAAGAPNLHFSFFDDVKDYHGEFDSLEDGSPFEYIGHFTWIPLFNGDCTFDYDNGPVIVDGKEVSLLEWLSYQHK